MRQKFKRGDRVLISVRDAKWYSPDRIWEFTEGKCDPGQLIVMLALGKLLPIQSFVLSNKNKHQNYRVITEFAGQTYTRWVHESDLKLYEFKTR